MSPPQAGPLPLKRGELGFQDGVHVQASVLDQGPTTPQPAHHPAERTATPPDTIPTAPDNGAQPSLETASIHTAGKRSIISILKPTRIFGVQLTTFLRFLLQLGVLGATIAGWALLAIQMTSKAKARASDGTDAPSFDSAIFIHVAFAIATLGQLLFLERVIFLLRAERYCHLHPGAQLPTSLRRGRGTTGGANTNAALAYAPWHRPPLPTYAAALMESGHGTGDVEDSQIAIPPPPEYGNTRGSTMLLSGFMSTTLRAQTRRARDSRGSEMSAANDRPLSYMSHDPAWDERVDASRAAQLEETLARLEDVEGRASTVSRMV